MKWKPLYYPTGKQIAHRLSELDMTGCWNSMGFLRPRGLEIRLQTFSGTGFQQSWHDIHRYTFPSFEDPAPRQSFFLQKSRFDQESSPRISHKKRVTKIQNHRMFSTVKILEFWFANFHVGFWLEAENYIVDWQLTSLRLNLLLSQTKNCALKENCSNSMALCLATQ